MPMPSSRRQARRRSPRVVDQLRVRVDIVGRRRQRQPCAVAIEDLPALCRRVDRPHALVERAVLELLRLATCRTTSRTEIAPKANAITANSATSRPADGGSRWWIALRSRALRPVVSPRKGPLRPDPRARTGRMEDADVVGETHAVPAGPGGDPARSGQGGLLAHQLEVVLGEALDRRSASPMRNDVWASRTFTTTMPKTIDPTTSTRAARGDRSAMARSRRRAAAGRPSGPTGRVPRRTGAGRAVAGAEEGADVRGGVRRSAGSNRRAGWLTRHGSVRRLGASRSVPWGSSLPRRGGAERLLRQDLEVLRAVVEPLDDAVLEGVVRDHDHAATGSEDLDRPRQGRGELLQLPVDRDAGAWNVRRAGWGPPPRPQRARDHARELVGGLDRRPRPRTHDRRRDPARASFLAVLEHDPRELLFGAVFTMSIARSPSGPSACPAARPPGTRTPLGTVELHRAHAEVVQDAVDPVLRGHVREPGPNGGEPLAEPRAEPWRPRSPGVAVETDHPSHAGPRAPPRDRPPRASRRSRSWPRRGTGGPRPP